MSFLSESVTLGLAVRSIRRSARKESMTFTEFVLSGYDPCVNVVLLEVSSLMLILILLLLLYSGRRGRGRGGDSCHRHGAQPRLGQPHPRRGEKTLISN